MSRRSITKVKIEISMTLPTGISSKSALEHIRRRVESPTEVKEPRFANLLVKLTSREVIYLT